MKNLVLLDKLVGWDSLIPYCDLSDLSSESFCGSWAQRSKEKKSFGFVPQLGTFEMQLRYWHENNHLHAPHKINSTPVFNSLSCNSAGTRPTQHLPLLCRKKWFAETKKLQSSAALHGPGHTEKASHKWAKILQKQNTSELDSSNDIFREGKKYLLELLKRSRENGKNTECKIPVFLCYLRFMWFEWNLSYYFQCKECSFRNLKFWNLLRILTKFNFKSPIFSTKYSVFL